MSCQDDRRGGDPVRFALLLAALAAASVSGPSVAAAQWERLALHAEVGAGPMLPEHQRDVLDYGAGIELGLRPAITIAGPLSIQAMVAGWIYPSDLGTGSTLTVGGGLRLEPEIGDLGRLFVDFDAGLGRTGGLNRFALDAGIGMHFWLGDLLALGPYVRYGHVFDADQDAGGDAITLVFGVAVSLRDRAREEEPVDRDTDEDGVLDSEDVCPTTPAGPTPDPERPGCPLVDTDGDGVPDRDDQCPDVAAGEHPDPARPGCPLTDTDGDGVFDPDDGCPTTPAGEHPDPDRPGCPDGDDDDDGVLNHQDRCPDRHQGPWPDPERPGCPLADRDNDTIPDVNDACPDEPGAPHPDPARNGCPSLVRVQEGAIRINTPVFFATNRDVILPRSRRVLQAVADAITASPYIRRVSIEGHTDDRASDDFNMDLSNRRANNVMAWLVQNGIEPERLEAHGFGETRPVVEGTTQQARAANRRVEFRIVDPPPDRSGAVEAGGGR